MGGSLCPGRGLQAFPFFRRKGVIDIAQDLLSSPFPAIMEQGVAWKGERRMYPAEEYKAIVDRNTGKVFSIVSKDYRVIRHERAIDEIESAISGVPALGGYEVTTEFYNAGGRMRREYVFVEHQVNVTAGDPVNPTLTLLNRYDTTWPFSVILGAFRLVCTNGLVIGLKLFSVKKRHVYDLEELSIQQGVSAALWQFSKQVKEWHGWADRLLAPKTYGRVMKAMALGKKGTEEIEGRMVEEGRGVDDEGFPIISLWLFYNTLTWYITHRAVSLNHRVEMEERLRKAMVHLSRA
jgi:hypothetical protein